MTSIFTIKTIETLDTNEIENKVMFSFADSFVYLEKMVQKGVADDVLVVEGVIEQLRGLIMDLEGDIQVKKAKIQKEEEVMQKEHDELVKQELK